METRTKPGAIVARVAWSICERADAQGWKGKRADGFALEAAIGALAAAIALEGDDTPNTNALSMFAYMVSLRGMAWVHERATGHTPAPAQQDAAP